MSYLNSDKFALELSKYLAGFKKLYSVAGTYTAELVTPNVDSHLASLPGFVCPRSKSALINFVDSVNSPKYDHIPTIYLNYLGSLNEEILKYCNSSFPMIHSTYKPYAEINLTSEIDEIKLGFKKDTRYRINKLLKEQFDVKIEYNPKFFEFYHNIASKQGFGNSYLFSNESLQKISNVEGIYAISVYLRNEYVGGAIIGDVDTINADYILSAYDINNSYAGRAVIYGSILACKKNNFQKLNLGGGIVGDDSLMKFKLSFGAKRREYLSMKIVKNVEHEQLADIKPIVSIFNKPIFP